MHEIYESYAEAWELVSPAMVRQGISRSEFIVRCWLKDNNLSPAKLYEPETAALLRAVLALAAQGESKLLEEIAGYIEA